MTNLLVLQRLMAPAEIPGSSVLQRLVAPAGNPSMRSIRQLIRGMRCINENRSSAQTFLTAQVHPLEQIQALGHRTFLTNRSEQILPQNPARLDQINRSTVVLT